MKSALTLVLASLVCWPLAGFLIHTVLMGLASGKIRHSTASRVCRRDDNPWGFWARVVLFSGIACLAAWAGLQLLLR